VRVAAALGAIQAMARRLWIAPRLEGAPEAARADAVAWHPHRGVLSVAVAPGVWARERGRLWLRSDPAERPVRSGDPRAAAERFARALAQAAQAAVPWQVVVLVPDMDEADLSREGIAWQAMGARGLADPEGFLSRAWPVLPARRMSRTAVARPPAEAGRRVAAVLDGKAVAPPADDAGRLPLDELLAAFPVGSGTPLRVPGDEFPRCGDIRRSIAEEIGSVPDAVLRSITRATVEAMQTQQRGSTAWSELERGEALLAEEATRRGVRPGLRRGPRSNPTITARAVLERALAPAYTNQRAAAAHAVHLLAAGRSVDEVIAALRDDPDGFGRRKRDAAAPEEDALRAALSGILESRSPR
jgi:hypothetical protein